jgi:hypothetical protein
VKAAKERRDQMKLNGKQKAEEKTSTPGGDEEKGWMRERKRGKRARRN